MDSNYLMTTSDSIFDSVLPLPAHVFPVLWRSCWRHGGPRDPDRLPEEWARPATHSLLLALPSCGHAADAHFKGELRRPAAPWKSSLLGAALRAFFSVACEPERGHIRGVVCHKEIAETLDFIFNSRRVGHHCGCPKSQDVQAGKDVWDDLV